MLTIEIEAAGPRLWNAYLGDQLLCTSSTPLVDGARALVELGHKRSKEVRMCPRGAEWCATKPSKLGEIAARGKPPAKNSPMAPNRVAVDACGGAK